ncbi:MAG: hypothetical protein MJZ74_07200 [Muribaculaceae bacterium]|nr:hypothetical protein [Muribaculaceae bacterium]
MDNNVLFYDLSENEMLALCKRVMKLEPVRRECAVEREDGIDMDAWIMMRARSWYARLLQEGPLEWLPVEDLKDEVTVTNCSNGVVKAMLPPCCIRPVEWRLEGWHHSVSTFAAAGDRVDLLQRNPWTRGGACQPVAVDHGNCLMLYSVARDATPAVVMARCVTCRPARFAFHQAALPSLEAALADVAV